MDEKTALRDTADASVGAQFLENVAAALDGRKLDYLIQEFNREANTIGSKGNDLEQARTVVEIKAELEKIREQIQNIE